MREQIYLPLLFLFTFLINYVTSDETSLFSEADHITQFNSDNFAGKVYNQKKAFFVEFYSSWCGACIAYAPTYKQFASAVQEWNPMIEVGSVNCADDKNTPLCREHAIDAFPTIKYFKYESKGKQDASRFNGEKFDMAVFPLEVAQVVREDWIKQKPKEWPNFDYVSNKSTVESLWQSAGPEVKLLVLVVEAHPPRNTWANIINFYSDKRVDVKLLSSGDPLAKSLGATSGDSPIAYIYKRGNNEPVFKSEPKATWTDIKEKIQEQIIAIGGAPKQKPNEGTGEQHAQPKTKVTWSQFEVELLDMTSAMSHILYSEIPKRQMIEGENLEGLKKFINMLKKYAPGTVPIRRLFYRLDQWLAPMTQVTSDQWLAEVDLVQADLGYPIPRNMTFLACRGSEPFLRGYSCGLWTLLHVVTVEAEKTAQNNASFNAVDELVEPIHQFIWKFFGCEECGKHFHTHVEKTDKASVQKAGDVIVWLWKTHNVVNKILAGSKSDDPAFPKQQFPPPSLCPTCRDNSGKFINSEVEDFLIRYYSDIKTNTAEQAPSYRVSEFQDGKLKNTDTKRFNPKFAVGADKVDKLEEAEQRLRRENVDANPQRRWKNIDSEDLVKPYDSSSGSTFFYTLWLFIVAVVVFFLYMKYRRNRTKFWKTFYYYNDYKLCPFSSSSHQNAHKFAV